MILQHDLEGFLEMVQIMDNEERISALSAYLECPMDAASQLNAKMTFKKFNHKEILLHQGDMNDQIWLILDGDAQLQAIGFDGKVTLLTAQGAGEVIGAYPNAQQTNVDVKIYGHLSTLQISTTDLKNIIDEYPSVGRGLSKILGNQYHAIINRLAMHVTLTAHGRVHAELLRLAQDSDIIAPYPVVTAVGLMAQTSRETASRAIAILRRRGIIEKNGQDLKILSRNMLEDLVI